MKKIRLEKIKNFEKFYDNCNSIFTKLRDDDKTVEIFENEYMLCICPGSRAGENEKRIVEVFWGSRAYEYETKGNQWKSLTETGATLFFYRNDTGDVTITIYPAKTEYRQPIENHIALYEWLDPKRLNDEKFIKSLWNDFNAYMECTSLDGKPTYSQKLRIKYLRFFKHLVIEKNWMPTEFSKFKTDIVKWVLTVGFSGLIIFAITYFTQPKITETEIQLKEINKKLEKIYKQIEKKTNLINETKLISSKSSNKKPNA